MPLGNLNYTILGLEDFEVIPYSVDENTLVKDILLDACSACSESSSAGEFWLLKQPIPFYRVASIPQLLDPSMNLKRHAIRYFLAEKLVDIWTNSDHRALHAIIRLK